MSDICFKQNWIIPLFRGNMYATKGVNPMKNVFDITPQQIQPQKKKRVAAYARVSSGKDAMLHSLKAQIDYYHDYINRNPEWAFAGIYADEAKTGTKDSRAVSTSFGRLPGQKNRYGRYKGNLQIRP